MTTKKAALFFEEFHGTPPLDFFSLAQSGSSRVNYVAKTADSSYIVTYNENLSENESFFYFSDVFQELQAKTPRVLHISNDRKCYIQQFLGTSTLSERISEEGLSPNIIKLVRATLQELQSIQQKTFSKIDYSKTFEYESYDELPITNDLFYFKNFIVEILEIPYHKSSLLQEFKELTASLENLMPKGLMMRDFQARNIMVNDDENVYFIDYQAAMEGPLLYDVVSFLFQAKANFPAAFQQEMLDYYYSLWKDKHTEDLLRQSLQPIKLIRFLQVLGAYGFRGLIQKKPHFLASLAQGIENLQQFAESWGEMHRYPELKRVILSLRDAKTQKALTELTGTGELYH